MQLETQQKKINKKKVIMRRKRNTRTATLTSYPVNHDPVVQICLFGGVGTTVDDRNTYVHINANTSFREI